MPPHPPSLACLCKSDIHVTPLLKILATGLSCIQTAVDSPNQYKTTVAKLKPLLKKGGLLVGAHGLGISEWTVQGEKYFPLTEDLVIASLQQAEFSVLEKKTRSLPLKKDNVQTAVGVTGLFTTAKATS